MSPEARRLRDMKNMCIGIHKALLLGEFDAAADRTLVLSEALDMELIRLSIKEAGGEWQGTR